MIVARPPIFRINDRFVLMSIFDEFFWGNNPLFVDDKRFVGPCADVKFVADSFDEPGIGQVSRDVLVRFAAIERETSVTMSGQDQRLVRIGSICRSCVGQIEFVQGACCSIDDKHALGSHDSSAAEPIETGVNRRGKFGDRTSFAKPLRCAVKFVVVPKDVFAGGRSRIRNRPKRSNMGSIELSGLFGDSGDFSALGFEANGRDAAMNASFSGFDPTRRDSDKPFGRVWSDDRRLGLDG